LSPLLDDFRPKNAKLDPLFNQVACSWIPLAACMTIDALEFGKLEEIKLASKCDKVSKQAVEMALAA
jgi:hypothetical protein